MFKSSDDVAMHPVSLWACGFSLACRDELMLLHSPPRHMFSDIFGMLRGEVKEEVIENAHRMTSSDFEALIKSSVSLTNHRAWCVKDQAMVPITVADIHIAGTPCPDSIGRRRTPHIAPHPNAVRHTTIAPHTTRPPPPPTTTTTGLAMMSTGGVLNL